MFEFPHVSPSTLLAALGGLVAIATAFFAGMRKGAEKEFSSLGSFLIAGVLFHPIRLIRGQAFLYFSGFAYAKRQLERPKIKYLQVPSEQDIRLEIDAAFVPLALEGPGSTFDHATVLEAGNRLRIVGDPGSGKSTIVKRLVPDQCKLLARWSTAHQGLLPVLIELRELEPPPDTDLGDWLLGEIANAATSFEAFKIKDCFSNFLKGRGLLILFDGAAEIVGEHYARMQEALNSISEKLAEKSSNNKIIITMRSQFHLQTRERYAAQYPTVLAVKPFTPADIFSLLNKWPFKRHGSQHAARIYADLSDRPSLRELCYNPLVLSMYVAEDQWRVGTDDAALAHLHVPDSRTEFYKQVVKELVLKRREGQRGQQTGGRKTVLRRRLQFFGALSYKHLMNPRQAANAIPFVEALEIVKQVYQIHAMDNDPEEEQAERILREISTDTGLFSEERRGEMIRFIHLTFVEYFTALHAIEQPIEGVKEGWSNLLERHKVNQDARETSLPVRLREVFPFAVHLAHEKDQPRLLGDVCAELSDDRLKASCFLETKAYQSEAWREFARGLPNALRSLLPNLEREEDAQKFYTFVAALRDAEAQGFLLEGSDSVDGILKGILEGNVERTFKAIDLMARYDAVAALRLADLCGAPLVEKHPYFLITNAAQPSFLGQMIQRAATEQARRDSWLVYSAVASCVVPAARAELAAKEQVSTLGRGDPRLESFWAWLLDVKKGLLTQILALAPESVERMKDVVPDVIDDFVREGLSRRHLVVAQRRARLRKGLLVDVGWITLGVFLVTYFIAFLEISRAWNSGAGSGSGQGWLWIALGAVTCGVFLKAVLYWILPMGNASYINLKLLKECSDSFVTRELDRHEHIPRAVRMMELMRAIAPVPDKRMIVRVGLPQGKGNGEAFIPDWHLDPRYECMERNFYRSWRLIRRACGGV